MATITRREIARSVSAAAGIGYVEALKLTRLVVDEIAKSAREGHRVDLRGLGIFKTKVRGAYFVKSRTTGESSEVPARSRIVFKATKIHKETEDE